VNIGGIILDWFTPTLTIDSSPAGKGQSAVTIGGAGPHELVDSVREMVENYRVRETIGGQQGVKVYIEFECPSLDSKNGWFLLQGFSQSYDKVHMDAIDSPEPELGHGDEAVLSFSITAARIGVQA
jgi:hypothetical protein